MHNLLSKPGHFWEWTRAPLIISQGLKVYAMTVSRSDFLLQYHKVCTGEKGKAFVCYDTQKNLWYSGSVQARGLVVGKTMPHWTLKAHFQLLSTSLTPPLPVHFLQGDGFSKMMALIKNTKSNSTITTTIKQTNLGFSPGASKLRSASGWLALGPDQSDPLLFLSWVLWGACSISNRLATGHHSSL